jgi:hypothetical protein
VVGHSSKQTNIFSLYQYDILWPVCCLTPSMFMPSTIKYTMPIVVVVVVVVGIK